MDLEQKCIDLLVKSLRPIPQELNEIDWKQGLTNKKERLRKHLSSFANLPGGGFLIYGVDDDGQIIGIEDKESRNIADTLANMARTSVEPQVTIKFITFSFYGKSLLGVYIEESFEKPVHIKNKGIERSYIRAGGQSRQMSRDELRRSIITSRSIRFGEIPAALSQDVLHRWENYFDFSSVIKRTIPAGIVDKEALNKYLTSLSLLYQVENSYAPTNLAVACCARDFSKLHSYEKFSIRMVEYSGNTKISAKRDITVKTGYSLGLDNIVETIMSWVPYNEIIEGATRVTYPAIPKIAVREVIANAIIHRDYTKTDSEIMIELYSDRLEVTNPGGLLPELSVDRLIDHPSRTRNEVLADLMRKMNFCEERGSGIDKAVISVEASGLPPISFMDGGGYFRVCIFSAKDYDSLDKEERIRAVYQHTCLNAVIQRKTTTRTIRERFKLSSDQRDKIYELIDDAIKVGKIKLANTESNSRRDHYYLPYWI